MTSRRQAFLALALLIAIVLSVVVGAVVPLVTRYSDNLDRIAELEARIARFREIAASPERIKADIARIERQMRAGETALFPSKPAAVVSADLQRQIKSLTESRGARLISSQPLNVDESERYAKVTTKVNFQGSLSALYQILFDIEDTRPKLFIDEILIMRRTAASAARTRSRGSRQTTDQGMLDVRLSVSGYMRNGGKDET